MTKMMLIDAVHPEEVRVAVVNKGQVEDFDFESAKKRQLRGNIYLAKITRVEPSLQAAFVDFGGNRHGFLAFNEIHPDYYQLPQADREALLAEASSVESDNGDDVDVDSDDEDEARPVVSSSIQKRYKIQEVIRRRQIMLVQAVKEERGNKGAALTTYLSLAGRYCVLMPNTPRGGGISRKITNAADRKRLKKIVGELNVPEGMGLIVRTAGAKRTKTEIKRDFEYLIKLWAKIRELTLSSVAPCMINEEAGLVHRALRDLYDKDIDQVLVDGDTAYREAKDLAKMLMPSHSKKVQQHRNGVPVLANYGVEQQLDNIYSPTVQLKSGGYLVIHQTEALVAIDVNSGKSTRERNIEQTALRTNMEAAEEACRQMRLRDLAGLIVIDFIDMEESKNNRAVERKMKDCLKFDRARVQNNKISMFGLMEISRQRRRAGILDSSSDPCDACNGTGHVRSVESAALHLLRAIEGRCAGLDGGEVEATAPTEVVLFLLNEKRQALTAIEARHSVNVQISARTDIQNGDYDLRVTNADGKTVEAPKIAKPPAAPIIDDDEEIEDEVVDEDETTTEEPTERSSGRRRRRRSRRGGSDNNKSSDNLSVIDEDSSESGDDNDGPVELGDDKSGNGDTDSPRKRRRRGRRGGRRRRGGRDNNIELVELNDDQVTEDGGAVLDEAATNVITLVGEETPISAEPLQAEAEVSEAPATEAETSVPSPAPEAEAPEPAEKEVEPDAVETADEPTSAQEEATTKIEEPVSDNVTELNPEPAEATPEDAEEPAELPETEKPRKIRRGWWQRKSAG
ncbi:MAG: ribonuclease E/G [Ponticaulis sp.]|nr:ribonuclease E/G [Ponticaulis sp.]|tara:strand:- start:14901 stop:17291 length:2391 start_codon:yes stop_codon:yes gene_type:complete